MDWQVSEIEQGYLAAGRSLDNIPSNEFYAPARIDLTHGRYICIDGVYYAYLLVPSDGYKSQVPAGWLSLIVNAGDGIDLDMFLSRQPKDRMIRKLGQQLRINRSKIKETSDTNTDFDDLDGAIRSGYFLKDGLGNNEDFYYLNLLITITASSVDELEWKCAEMKKLLLSQDMDVQPCSFCQEQAFLSSLPLVSLERSLFERSKRNVLTLGAASCYPFTSYEMCDDNGILLGVNKHNNSLIIVDIFDSRVYKGTVLDVGERSALIIPDGGTDYTVSSGSPTVLAVEQVSGYWVIEGVSPGTSQVQFTAPDGQQGDLAITVTKDGTLTNSASADLNENLELRQDILVLVNQVRQEHGLSAVPADQSLMDAAQDYATRRNTWHDSQEECELALAHGYPYGFNCNLTVFTGASAEGAAKTAVENWVNSPGHLRTMLDSKADGLGVGVVRHEGVTYCYLFVGMSSTINPYA